MLRPVGSLPPGVYWFRRLLVAAMVLVVLLAGWWLVGGRGGSSPTGASSPGPSSGSSGSQSPHSSATSSSPAATQSATTTATSTPTHSASPTATPLCATSAIHVLAETDLGAYAPTVEPRFTLQVTNAGTTPCRRDLGQSAVELVVMQGSTHIWSSDDCNPGGGSAIVTLRAGQTFSTTVVWSRQTSKPGCPAGLPKAAAGVYQLLARNLTLTSAPAAFTLH